MLRKSNIDKDPNSIFNASSKLATISVRNIKNPSDDPNMQLGLNKYWNYHHQILEIILL